jgi:cupin 2 domain-containing protein
MGRSDGNIFEHVPERLPEEQLTELLVAPGLKIERIVSTGQASPAGFWYNQDQAEWVLVIAGSAGLLIEGEPEPRVLGRGDYVLIPARVRHRVAWTDQGSRRSGWRCTTDEDRRSHSGKARFQCVGRDTS